MNRLSEPDALEKDRQLWQALKNGDAQALEALFRSHVVFLRDYGVRLCGREELVEDGIQEVFLQLWEKRQSLSEINSARVYLLVALKNRLLNALARKKRAQAAHEQYGILLDDESFSLEEIFIAREEEAAKKRALEAALKQISPRQREAFYLKTREELSYNEIAETMNISPQVARNYVSEVYEKLRELLPAFKP